METESRSRLIREPKVEEDLADTRMADDRHTYRSWKKKYRKMRIKFDQKMHEGEDLHKQEQKALATARRLAVQKDRLLDLLLDVNNCPQIPPEKRFDVSLDPPSDADAPALDIDRPGTPPPGVPPAKSYKKLLKEIPHVTYATATHEFRDQLNDLEAGRDSPADPAQGQPHPPSFLTADDIDNYIYDIDIRLAEAEFAKTGKMPALLPTLAPLAHAHDNVSTNGKDGPLSSNRDFALRNPTSVYNWLRKHAPKTFLQDGEHDKENGDEQHASTGRGHGRGKGERGGRGGARGKRASAAHARDRGSVGDDMDEEMGYDAVTPSTGVGKGKRKRVVDDDPGYRPKGGSSRPAKKKRKSEGLDTPTAPAKKPRKSGLGAETSAVRGGED
ncbi:IEC3 subunit of the Ino80 complex, chromatin re-modelling-domain-containing protein [Echria macrotheca]|uniref:IEC3 subunit of the Ino80 complex, chromatin re-modelling-domain-containing protein n=1 Tax=Echria macrotheca TaxID=438768 RepID=A0AAJ0F270_9PEZI|nr:IEC3 subunit of the Ino80 complex, chromatin re-modelling-domain-containing protein [Echria macrotheca]